MNFLGQYDGLIFDCDGTLTDSMPLHYEAWVETLDRYAIAFPKERFYSMAGMPTDKIVDVLRIEQSVVLDVVLAAEEKEQAFERRLNQLQPLVRTCSIAREHHTALPMAVASGGIRRVIGAQLRQIGVESLFATVVTAEDTEKHKPEPEVFLEAARRLGVDPRRCLVFEDSPLGFEAADRAGMAWMDVRPWSAL